MSLLDTAPRPSRRRVADLHCDLLTYLVVGEMQEKERSPHDDLSRASIGQMRDGGVALQTLAIFVMTAPGWSRIGLQEAEIFARIVERNPDHLRTVGTLADLPSQGSAEQPIGVIAAVENASAFAEEDEPLDAALKRYEQLTRVTGPLLYVSLTWNDENRFGGGNGTDVGLKDDGRALLDFLADRGPAVDFSHTSPRLADEILDYTYKKGLDIPVLASHSPYAALVDIPRNLTDRAAREIAARGGVIGLNLLARFLKGETPECFADQIRHAQSLDILNAQVMGADFFYEGDIPDRPEDAPEFEFHPGFDSSACYPRLFDALRDTLGLDERTLDDLAWGNFERFAGRVLAAH